MSRARPDADLPRNKTMVMVEIHSNQYYEDRVDVFWLPGRLDDYGDPIYEEWTPPEGVNPWEVLRDLPNLVGARSDCGQVVSICTAVPVGRIRDYLHGDIQKWLAERGKPGSTSIVCDAGVGICRINLAVGSGRRWSRAAALQFKDRALDRARYWGGTASGLYGFGSTLVDRHVAEKPKDIGVLRSIKNLLDPKGILNPDKLVDWLPGG